MLIVWLFARLLFVCSFVIVIVRCLFARVLLSLFAVCLLVCSYIFHPEREQTSERLLMWL